MSHELLTIAHVHAYRDEMLSDSGSGGPGKRPAAERRPSRLRTLAGIASIRIGSWLLRRRVEGLGPAPLAGPDPIRLTEHQPAHPG